ncbi:MAG: glycosyltransferase family 4 protein [Actinobacteria bacterium]|nr:glycosyltransferase family 4 protein [Actinomycetota bacterium]
MKLLVICPHYAPDVAPTGEVMTAIANALIERGHTLDIVTALPWYRKHAIEPGWDHKLTQTEKTPWGSITRLHPFPTSKSNIPARALAFGGFTGVATVAAAVRRNTPDAVLVMSPPLILGITGWLAAKRWRVPMVFNIQDVFPDVAVEVGAITNPKVIAVAKWLERFLYLRSDAVTVLSEDLRGNLAAKIADNRPERVRVIPNFVDTERIAPADRMTSYREEFGLGDRTVVMYAGNIGYSQSLDLLVGAAKRFAERDDVVFVVNGEGSGLNEVRGSADGLDNIVFAPLQPKDRLPEVLATGDIHTILLKRGLARSSVPSKMYSILAAGRPCVSSVDEGTEVERSLVAAGAGTAVPPEDLDSFCAALEPLLNDAALRRTLGDNGRRWVEGWASPAAVAESYEELFDELIAARR